MTYSNTYSSPSSPTNFNPFSGLGMRKGGRPSLFPGSGDGSTLSLDFTTGVLDSRLTFSRASTATFVNSSGYVENAGANTAVRSELLTLGSGYNDEACLARGTTTSPTGGTAVVLFPTSAAGYHRLQFSYGVAMGARATVSCFVKRVNSNYNAGINSGGYIGASALFNLNGNGSVIVSTAGSSPTITKVTDDGWFRISITGNFVGVTSTYVYMDTPSNTTDSTGSGSLAGTDGQGMAYWGFQVNPGSLQQYYPTNAAGTLYYAPRFDYSPTTIGEPRGLLIEGQTANPILYSQDFSQATWSKSNATATVPTTAPDGTTTAYLLTSTTAGGTISQTHAATGNATSTYSIYVKQGTAAYCDLYIYDAIAGATRLNVRFTFATKVFTVTAGSNAAYQELPNGWFRISATCTALSTTNNIISYLYVGFAVAGTTYYGWGAQLEAGSGASSYIPTGASQVTRNADICYIPISSIGFSTSGGTFFTSFYRGEANLGTTQAGSAINTDYADTRWLGIGSGYGATTFNAGSWNVSINKVGVGVFGLNKAAASYASWTTSTTGVFTANGATAATGTLSNLGTTPNYLMIGSASQSSPYNGIGLRDHLNNSIRSIKYYPTALTAAQLQTLTAL